MKSGGIFSYDESGRITRFDISTSSGSGVTNGHSVCYNCGKDMPAGWDAVCKKCGIAMCHDCSIMVGNEWRCIEHSVGPSPVEQVFPFLVWLKKAEELMKRRK